MVYVYILKSVLVKEQFHNYRITRRINTKWKRFIAHENQANSPLATHTNTRLIPQYLYENLTNSPVPIWKPGQIPQYLYENQANSAVATHMRTRLIPQYLYENLTNAPVPTWKPG